MGIASPLPSPLVGEGGEMRFSIEPDEGYSLTLALSQGEREKVTAALAPAVDSRVEPANDASVFLLPLWEKVARCVSASSRMRGS